VVETLDGHHLGIKESSFINGFAKMALEVFASHIQDTLNSGERLPLCEHLFCRNWCIYKTLVAPFFSFFVFFF